MGRRFQESHQVDIELLKTLTVMSEKEETISLASMWEKESLIIIFVRHFGCIACRAHVQNVWGQREKFLRANTRIIFISSGAPYAIKTFKEDLNIPDATIFTDPSLRTFDACGLKRGVLNLLDPRGVKKMVELSLQGHRQGEWSQDTGFHTQMGGVVALRPPGKVVYHFVSEYLGDDESNIPFSDAA